jgi:protocatechuate 3,4-dioxygenase alpha subunit
MDDDRVTPAQTIGPFFHQGWAWLVTASGNQQRSGEGWATVSGTVADGDGQGVPDAALEVWQSMPGLEDPGLAGFQRVHTGPGGEYTFGVHRAAEGPAYAHVTIFARGLLAALRTRVYLNVTMAQLEGFQDLRHVPRDRLGTLAATPAGDDPTRWTWNIRLQGAAETVFFTLL